MRHILRAVLRSQKKAMHRYASGPTDMATGQAPKGMFVTCADSRIVPKALMSVYPGDLFVVRSVGNLIPPVDAHGRSTGDVYEASAVVYAVDALDVGEIVVCGHANCGAMLAALAPGGPSDPNLAKWLSLTAPLRDRLSWSNTCDPALTPHDQLSQWNTLEQLEHLQTYPTVRRAVERGTLTLHAMWFDFARARALVFSPEAQRFVAVENVDLPAASAA